MEQTKEHIHGQKWESECFCPLVQTCACGGIQRPRSVWWLISSKSCSGFCFWKLISQTSVKQNWSKSGHSLFSFIRKVKNSETLVWPDDRGLNAARSLHVKTCSISGVSAVLDLSRLCLCLAKVNFCIFSWQEQRKWSWPSSIYWRQRVSEKTWAHTEQEMSEEM